MPWHLLTSSGAVITGAEDLVTFITNRFRLLYSKAVPFNFEGFQNKNTTTAKKDVTTIARMAATAISTTSR